MEASADWPSLQKRGFVVIKQFLSADQCAELAKCYETLPAATDSIGFGVRWAIEACCTAFCLATPHEPAYSLQLGAGLLWAMMGLPPSVMQKIHEALPLVEKYTDIKVSTECCHLMNSMQAPPREANGALVYATKQVGQNNSFPWHTDHGTFYKAQSHAEQLNFYIPIQKTRPDKSGLALVPADTLRKHDPSFAATNPGGASVFFKCDEGESVPYVCYADCRDTAYPLACDLDEVSISPHLEAGDLLLLHMPIIHRTQDNETARIALSYRVCLPASRLDRRAAFPMNWHQFRTEEAWWDELLFSLMWFTLWPRYISLERKARFLESPSRAWNECGLASRALVAAASPLFALGVAFKCGRSYVKRAISRRFVFGGLTKEAMIGTGKTTPNRLWWRCFPAYIALLDRL